MSNCLNLIPILSRPEYRIRWTNTAAINLTFDPVTKKYLLGQSEILNVIGDLIVEERYKVTRFVIGGPAVGSWTPWARTTRLPITGAVLKFYIRTSGKNWIEIGNNGINVNQTYLNTLSGGNQLEAKAEMSVPSGVFRCSSEVTTSTSRAININKGVATTVTWGSTFISPSTVFKGSNSTSPRPNLTGQVTYVRPSTGQVTTINAALKITSNLHPGQTFDASSTFNLDVLKVGNHTLTLNYVNPLDGTLASSSAVKILINIVDPKITFNLSSCNVPAGRAPQDFLLPKFSSNQRWSTTTLGPVILRYTINGLEKQNRYTNAAVLPDLKINSGIPYMPQPGVVKPETVNVIFRTDSTGRSWITVAGNCPSTGSLNREVPLDLFVNNVKVASFLFTLKR